MRTSYTLGRFHFSIPELGFVEDVTVPHTWNTDPRIMNRKGKAAYETEVFVDGDKEGQEAFLTFHGVFHTANVFVNGNLVGMHTGSGYTPFRFEIAEALQYGAENSIRVEVDNEHTEELLPWKDEFDWADDGGLIRPVTMDFIPKTGFSYLHISANITEYAEDAAFGSGELLLQTAYIDKVPKAGHVLVQDYRTYETLYEADYPVLTEELRIPFTRWKLWSPEHPELLLVTVSSETDIISERTGLRDVETRGEQVYLNGEPIYLRSCEWMPGSHPDYGMAEPLTHSIRCLRQLKDAGCIFTRFHWQQDTSLFDWCDENGLMVQEEIPYWGSPKKAGPRQLEIAKGQAEEMVFFHTNHPSIICWGVGNELGGPEPETIDYVDKMYAYFKALDRNRLVNYVSNTLSNVENAEKDDAALHGDIAMWNEYLGLWEPSDDIPAHIMRTGKKAAGMPVMVSEFGLCEPKFPGGDVRRCEILRQRLEIYKEVPNMVGYMWFSLNDYRTHMGEEGEGRMKRRVHGSVDIYGNEKPSYRLLCELQKKQTE